jgi:hypothetical protein
MESSVRIFAILLHLL